MSNASNPLMLFLILPLISLLSLFAGRKSHLAITNLSGGKNRAERAAEYSDKAAGQLHGTRRTQASCAVAILLSLISSLALLFFHTFFTTSSSSSSSSSSSWFWTTVLPYLNIAACAAAHLHNRSFWGAKAKVPFADGFNEGIENSKLIRQLLVAIGTGWGIVIVIVGMSG
ncbi:hypothetical protein BDR22DRAFT_91862 [Usnea florida]